MKESGTLSHSKKYMGHSLRKSTLMLGSRVSSCVSKRSDTEKRPSRPTIRLIDQNGLDLTPLPLLTDDKRFRDDRETSNDCTASIHSGSSLHITNPFAFTRSLVSVSSPTGDSRSEASDDNVERYHAYTEIKTLIQPQHEELSEADLNKLVDIKIAETDTFWIFDQPPTVLSQDSEDALQQIKRNTAYKALVTGRLGNDRYMERGMNTFNCPVIAKSVQTSRIAMHERSTMVTVWEMADTFQAELTDEEPQMPEAVSPVEQVRKTKSVSQSPLLQPDDGGPIEPSKVPVLKDFTVTTEPGSVAGTSEGSRLGTSITPKDTMVSNSESDLFGFRYSVSSQPSILTGALDILALPKLKKDIHRMERALNVNTYFEKLLQYNALSLRMIMNPASIERSDTDPSSTGHKASALAVPSTTAVTEDNSAGQGTGGKHSTTAHTANSHSLGSVSQGGAARTGDATSQATDQPTLNPDTTLLWRYQCQRTKGQNITDMAWNRENSNILAVGYGQFEFENQRKGLVCCWSIKYIDHPERTYETPSGVTAVGWSKVHSNLLAVGMFSGVIQVFDVRKTEAVPVIDTTHASGRHLGAVRKLQWVVRQSGRAENLSEVLVSVSTDGRVVEWFVRKGFDSTGDCDYHCDLMVLKRSYVTMPGSVNKSKRTESLISRTAFGSCMAFNKREPSIYVVGTEDGPIHKCSCSYNEQYLDTFLGHTAPVYQIEWSPFVSDVFLSCSADWTVKVWHLDHQRPLINIQTNLSTVSSISWSPYHSIIFAAANESALELWNLDTSTIEPFVVETVSSDTNMTSVLFSDCSESVLVGDNQGTVHVYGLVDFPETPTNTEAQVAKLNEILQTCIKDQS